MLAGLPSYTSSFLSDVNSAETRINTANQQLSSGYRVNVASDDPGAIEAILGFQSQIDQVTQVQTNLSTASAVATSSDGALTTASSLLDQLTSIAAQGASSSATAATRSSLAKQVQGIGEQMVALANTNFAGKYVFGGDDPTTQPYTSNFAALPTTPASLGYTQNNTAGSTVTLANSDGDTIIPGQTAQQVFDTQTAGAIPPATVPAAGNILANIGNLILALQTNNQTAISTGYPAVPASGLNPAVPAVPSIVSALQASVDQLGQATTASGVTIDWIQQSTTAATAKLTNLDSQLSALRDTDATQAATNLTTAETAMSAAIAAQGTMNIKTLFSYLG
jgi:flagellar hook-associated protein 3 FlgL